MSWQTDTMARPKATGRPAVEWRQAPTLSFFSPVIPMIDWGQNGIVTAQQLELVSKIDQKTNHFSAPKK